MTLAVPRKNKKQNWRGWPAKTETEFFSQISLDNLPICGIVIPGVKTAAPLPAA
jgi:hypothetical protein